ncbi:hypothetical protein AB0M02_39790 [Actinoplanes sp. NPDC051861]|uniref:hypothetical protein n=1 Tax=Actinoplanes sp. NPDC051861 TaxID=3155170 RepID=UPI0034470E90
MAGRLLRPVVLARDTGPLWAVDELQPVAALLDPRDGAVTRLVSWTGLPPPPAGESWRVLAAGDDLWVQPGPGGPVARVDPEGGVHAGYSAGRRLVAADARGAWCVDSQNDQVLVSDPEEEPGPLPGDQVIVVTGDGSVRRIEVDRPVRDVRAGGEAVHLVVDDEPHAVKPLGGSTWELTWRRAWMRVPPGPLPESLRLADAEVGKPSLPHATVLGEHWIHAEEPEGYGVRAGDRRWVASSRPGDDRFVVFGHADDGDPPARADAGPGQALAMVGTGTGVWISMRRPDGTVEVVRLDPGTGAIGTALAKVDIGDHCWPMSSPPADAESYARYQRDCFTDLDNAWHDLTTGTSTPLAGHTSRWESDLAGSWPDTQLVLSFEHQRYPGLRLRRRVRLFDELGRPTPPEFADIHLMEDIDTGSLPPAAGAVDGLLDV